MVWSLQWLDEINFEPLQFTSFINLKNVNQINLRQAIETDHMIHIYKSLLYDESGFQNVMPIIPCHLVNLLYSH